MVELRTLEYGMFPELFRTFLRKEDDLLQEADWARLFVHRSAAENERLGFVLLSGGQIVGMLGTLHSRRDINGGPERFCNLHSWYVSPEFRGHSLFLLQRAISDRSVTLTDFTPTKHVTDISHRLGLRSIESRLHILFPQLRRSRLRGELLDDPESMQAHLNERDQVLLSDHLDAPCKHLLLRLDSAYCYLIYSRIDRWRLPYCYVHYVSDPGLFAEHDGPLRSALMAKTGTRFVAMDCRRLAGRRIQSSLRMPFGCRQLFRSRTVQPENIDSLYSELVFLNLTTFPDLSTSIAMIRGK